MVGKLESSFFLEDIYCIVVGLLGCLFYFYDDCYMIIVFVCCDVYLVFGEKEFWVIFFFVVLVWIFINEKFFKWELMSMGKLRFLWGVNGNCVINNFYLVFVIFDIGVKMFSYLDVLGNLKEMEYLKIGCMVNFDLKWEKSEVYNVGLDFGFLNNCIIGFLEGYVIKIKDMIMGCMFFFFIGFDEIVINLGEVQNKGVELIFNLQNMVMKNFEWNISFSFVYMNNEVKYLYGEYENVFDVNGNIVGSKEKDEYGKWWIGCFIFVIWDYCVIGIW